jgi:hypothetical protein
MSLLNRMALEWWQALIVVLVIGMLPLFKAAAVILVARFVKPEIAKLALPLIFHQRMSRTTKNPEPPRKTDTAVQ